MSNKVDELRKLAKEAIELRKKIKEYTEELSHIKDQFIEKSKNIDFSFKIKIDEGSVKAIRNKKENIFKVKAKDFDKLNREAKKSLYKSGLIGVKVFLKTDEYEKALKNNTVPKTLADLVHTTNKKRFTLYVYIDELEHSKMAAIINDDEETLSDDEVWEDIYLNVYPPDYEHFTDDDPADLSEVEKDDLGIERDVDEDEEE
jgi:hypothetical protein